MSNVDPFEAPLLSSSFNSESLDSNISTLNNIGVGSFDAFSSQINNDSISFNPIQMSVNTPFADSSNQASASMTLLNQSSFNTHQLSQDSTPTSSTTTTPIALNHPQSSLSINGTLKSSSTHRDFAKHSLPTTPFAANSSLAPSLSSSTSSPSFYNGSIHSRSSTSDATDTNQLPPYKGVSLACKLEIDSDFGEDRILRRLQKREVKAINEIQSFRQEALDLCNLYATETGDVRWLRLMVLNNDFHHKTINDHLKLKQEASLAAKAHVSQTNVSSFEESSTNSINFPPQLKYLEEAREILKKVETRDKRLRKLRSDFYDHLKSLDSGVATDLSTHLEDSTSPLSSTPNNTNIADSSSALSIPYLSKLAPQNSSSVGILQSQIPSGFLPSPASSTPAKTTPFGYLSTQKSIPYTVPSSLEPSTPVPSLTSVVSATPTGPTPLSLYGSQLHARLARQQQQLPTQSPQLLTKFSQQHNASISLSQLTPTSTTSPLLRNSPVRPAVNILENYPRTPSQSVISNTTKDFYLANNANLLPPNLTMFGSSFTTSSKNNTCSLQNGEPTIDGVSSNEGNELNFDSLENLANLESLVDLNNLNSFNVVESLEPIDVLDSLTNKHTQLKDGDISTKVESDDNSNLGQNNSIQHLGTSISDTSFSLPVNLDGLGGLNVDFSDFSSLTSTGSQSSESLGIVQPSQISNDILITNIYKPPTLSALTSNSNPPVSKKRSYDDIQSSSPVFSPTSILPGSHTGLSSRQSPNVRRRSSTNYSKSPVIFTNPATHSHPHISNGSFHSQMQQLQQSHFGP